MCDNSGATNNATKSARIFRGVGNALDFFMMRSDSRKNTRVDIILTYEIQKYSQSEKKYGFPYKNTVFLDVCTSSGVKFIPDSQCTENPKIIFSLHVST